QELPVFKVGDDRFPQYFTSSKYQPSSGSRNLKDLLFQNGKILLNGEGVPIRNTRKLNSSFVEGPCNAVAFIQNQKRSFIFLEIVIFMGEEKNSPEAKTWCSFSEYAGMILDSKSLGLKKAMQHLRMLETLRAKCMEQAGITDIDVDP